MNEASNKLVEQLASASSVDADSVRRVLSELGFEHLERGPFADRIEELSPRDLHLSASFGDILVSY